MGSKTYYRATEAKTNATDSDSATDTAAFLGKQHSLRRATDPDTDTDTQSVAAVDTTALWYSDRDVRLVPETQRPDEIPAGARWIAVDLATQTLVAYEGDKSRYITLISSGKKLRDWQSKDSASDHSTPTGIFQIKSKHLTHTMDGDTAFDGPYSVDDVPYVMYFQLSYALHSAFWHSGFGYPRSHGCVNLAPLDAKWVFNWSTPKLPKSWHMAAADDTPTYLYIFGETR